MKCYYARREDGISLRLDATTLDAAKSETDRWILLLRFLGKYRIIKNIHGMDIRVIQRDRRDDGDYDDIAVAIRPWVPWMDAWNYSLYEKKKNPIKTRGGFHSDWVDFVAQPKTLTDRGNNRAYQLGIKTKYLDLNG